MNTPKFKIGQKVYYVLSESKAGIVIDVQYSYKTKLFEYQVSFDPTIDSLWYDDLELSVNPIYTI